MKRLAIVFIVALMGCGQKSAEPSNEPSQKNELVKGDYPHKDRFSAVEIDDCQYIVYSYGYWFGMVHKGNCNNPIHSK